MAYYRFFKNSMNCSSRIQTKYYRGELDGELARNAEIEADIKKWALYQNHGSKEDAAKIEQLESELSEHNGNTQGVIDFINRQISNGQQQFDARQAAEEDKMRKDAFDEAIRFVWDYSIHFYF